MNALFDTTAQETFVTATIDRDTLATANGFIKPDSELVLDLGDDVVLIGTYVDYDPVSRYALVIIEGEKWFIAASELLNVITAIVHGNVTVAVQ